MIALNNSTITELPVGVRRFSYDRAMISPGIVHLSVGNFHRAHAASYVDALLERAGNERWGLCGVGLIDDVAERRKADAFRQQDNLYTLTRFPPSDEAQHQVIGSIVDYLFAPRDFLGVLQRLEDPATRIVTLTITEGGYNRDKHTGEYRLGNPATVAELTHPQRPTSAFGYIVEGLRRRRERAIAPFTVLSCDNVRDNGRVMRGAILSHARALDPLLADWIDEHVTFPNCMVDRITPAVGPQDAERINVTTGIDDLIPVFSEDYKDWVIEDVFCNGRPPFEEVGVRMVRDVSPYERAKLRMLNASHSMLAYPGLLAGLRLASEALAEPAIFRFLDQFMGHDVIPGLPAPPNMNLHDYKDSVLARFTNRALPDQLTRIAGDGAVKLPIFLAPTLRYVLDAGGDHRRLAFGLACFVRYLSGIDDNGKSFEPFEPALDPKDKALALDTDPRAALNMTMFDDFGDIRNGAFPDTFLRMRAAVDKRGALAALSELTD